MRYIIDLDGTLMNGNQANLDSVSFIKRLQEQGDAFVVMTNSMKSPAIIQQRLSQIDIHVETAQILNPIIAMNTYLSRRGIQKVYIVGSPNEVIQVQAQHEVDYPEMVVLLDFERENTSFKALQCIFEHIQNGVPVITASRSPFYLSDQKRILDTGAFVKLFEEAGGIEIEVIGKPSKLYFESGAHLLNASPNQVVVIGDDWQTDILGAKAAGCKRILLKSGKYQAGDENKSEDTICVASFSEILMKPSIHKT